MATITERPVPDSLRMEKGMQLAQTTLEALRVTVRNLNGQLRLKDTPLFDQARADLLSRRQKEYIKILLQLRKQGIRVDIAVGLKQGKDEKLNPYSQNQVHITLPSEQPLGRRVVAKIRLSELGPEKLEDKLELLGEKTITEDPPLSYLRRTCSELYALRQDIKLAQIDGGHKSARAQKLRSLEYTIIRNRFLEPAVEGLTPEGAVIDIESDSKTRTSRTPNINVHVSLPIGHEIKSFHYVVFGQIINSDPKARTILERVRPKAAASQQQEIRS